MLLLYIVSMTYFFQTLFFWYMLHTLVISIMLFYFFLCDGMVYYTEFYPGVLFVLSKNYFFIVMSIISIIVFSLHFISTFMFKFGGTMRAM